MVFLAWIVFLGMFVVMIAGIAFIPAIPIAFIIMLVVKKVFSNSLGRTCRIITLCLIGVVAIPVVWNIISVITRDPAQRGEYDTIIQIVTVFVIIVTAIAAWFRARSNKFDSQNKFRHFIPMAMLVSLSWYGNVLAYRISQL